MVGIFGLVASKLNHGPTYSFLHVWLLLVISVYILNLAISLVFQQLKPTENIDDLQQWNETTHKHFFPGEAFEVACNCTGHEPPKNMLAEDCSGKFCFFLNNFSKLQCKN